MNFALLTFISTEKLHLILAGFYPAKRIKYRYLYILSSIVNFLISWLHLLSMAVMFFINTSDLEKVSEILLYCMTQCAFLIKLTNFILQKNNLIKLEAMLKNYLFNNLTDEEMIILKPHVQKGKMLAIAYRSWIFGTIILFALFPFLNNRTGSTYVYPLSCWFPFDENNYYYQVFFGEILSMFVGAWINSNIDILAVKYCIMATAEFEILSNRIMTILKPSEVTEVHEMEVEVRLKQCAIHYDQLLCFVQQIEVTFSKGIFVQFLCSVLGMCLNGFQTLVIPFGGLQYITLISYMFSMLSQVALYCWSGHNVIESSEAVRDACYLSEWNESSLSVRKSLMIIMERAKRPAVLMAGNFFVLNIPTLMKILKSSYSYFAVLQQVHSKK